MFTKREGSNARLQLLEILRDPGPGPTLVKERGLWAFHLAPPRHKVTRAELSDPQTLAGQK